MMAMLDPRILATYLHRIDPFIVEFPPGSGMGLRWYGTAYLAGAIVGYLILHWMAKRGRAMIRPELTFDFCLNVLIGAFIGGRLGFCLLYQPELLGFTDKFPYWGVFALQNGGMASHGGIIGALIAIWIFSYRHKVPLLHLLDLACLAGPLGIGFGRIANFINGELYGRPCPPNLWWGVKFPQELLSRDGERLADLSPAAKQVGVEPVEWLKWIDDPVQFREQLTGTLQQIIEAIQQGNAQVIPIVEPILTPRYPSQLIQAGLEGFLVFTALAILWSWPRKPGVVAGSFVVLYAIARIIGEQFRMPDADIGFELFGLTRGQELSILMLLGGIVFVAICALRTTPKFPAWIGPAIPRPEQPPHSATSK
jgi:phosphatidylglycerol:prolipoprotein diacylglycerol transferase